MQRDGRMDGLLPVSRCQLWLAIAMYVGTPAWLGFMLLGLIRQGPFRPDIGAIVLALTLLMSFAPKLATLVDVLARPRLRAAFGGVPRIVAGAVLETLFTLLIVPVCAVSVTLFVIGLPFGRQVGWAAQLRDADGIPFGVALRRLWPHTLVGLAFSVWLARVAPGALWLGIGTPFALGLVGAIPIAMLTAHPAVGRALGRIGLCRVPEEVRPPAAAGAAALFRPFAVAAGSE